MKLLFLGDSLIEYFDWQQRFPDHVTGNYGIAGESVQGLLSRVMTIRESFAEADIVFIMSGINNVAMGDDNFTGTYRAIIERLQSAYPGARIIANTLFPVSMDFISNETIKVVNMELEKLVEETGIELLNIYKRFVDTKGGAISEYLLEDGVHLSKDGYAVWSGAIEEAIKNKSDIRPPHNNRP
jgi:lysophospholipase L1-like esterase